MLYALGSLRSLSIYHLGGNSPIDELNIGALGRLKELTALEIQQIFIYDDAIIDQSKGISIALTLNNLTQISVKQLTPSYQILSGLPKFINNITIHKVNSHLVKFKVPLSVAKLMQIIRYLPNVTQFYLVVLPTDDFNDLFELIINNPYVMFNVELLKVNGDILKDLIYYNNVTVKSIFITD